MSKRISKVIEEVSQKISPFESEKKQLQKQVNLFLRNINLKIKKLKIKATPFIGGSFAKNTFLKTDKYEADIFIRFDKNYTEIQINKFLKLILKDYKKQASIHGSRDYYQISLSDNFYVEVVPVKKISNPLEAQNTTDLSYFHVTYVKNKIKSNKMQQEILVAKKFAKACGCYGAESYINGFSGYSLELLIIKYKTFENFIKQILKQKITKKIQKNLSTKEYELKANEFENKIIIDLEKHYKNKNHILIDLNESKTHSPIILIDPTFKERNALAALNEKTFLKFQNYCKEFLTNPSTSFFEKKSFDLNNFKEKSLKNKFEFVSLLIQTNKQEGDIAGTKLLKFYNFLLKELQRFFEIKESHFEYDLTQLGKIFLSLNPKKEIIFPGPLKKDLKHLKDFKKNHNKIFFKQNRAYAKKEMDLNFSSFFKKYIRKTQLKEMSIIKLEIIKL